MTLVKFRPNNDLHFPRFKSFFDDFMNRDWNEGFELKGTQPRVNILDKADQFEIHFAAPGLNKSDFNISVDNDILKVSYEKEMEKKGEGNNDGYTLREFSYEKFERSFNLPDAVNREKIDASYKDGVLNIIVPKKEEAKVQPVKEIKIS